MLNNVDHAVLLAIALVVAIISISVVVIVSGASSVGPTHLADLIIALAAALAGFSWPKAKS